MITEEVKPFIKKLTQEEHRRIIDQAMEALDRDDEDTYESLCLMLPVDPETANDLKKSMGLKGLILSGINLVEAVESYGPQWLRG